MRLLSHVCKTIFLSLFFQRKSKGCKYVFLYVSSETLTVFKTGIANEIRKLSMRCASYNCKENFRRIIMIVLCRVPGTSNVLWNLARYFRIIFGLPEIPPLSNSASMSMPMYAMPQMYGPTMPMPTMAMPTNQ